MRSTDELMGTADVVRAVVDGHDVVRAAVAAVQDDIARLVDAAAARAGRVVYVGAGTGGRLAAMDACEWGPTFGVPDGAAVAVLARAGLAPGSFADEASEDDVAAGAAAMADLGVVAEDVVIGVSASGSTPFVVGALQAAAEVDVLTAAVVGRRGSPLAALVAIPIEVPVGPEVVAGSTRLKAGTAQKLVLNAFSTALMVRGGRTVRGLMGGMRVANAKLRDRATDVCVRATGCAEGVARSALADAGWELDTALVMIAAGLDPERARERLSATGGAIEEAMR
ncbi:MAG TPA: N-acetylmuramic acid 6-phosphate etherase [Solirubrobacteraceae bacterium]